MSPVLAFWLAWFSVPSHTETRRAHWRVVMVRPGPKVCLVPSERWLTFSRTLAARLSRRVNLGCLEDEIEAKLLRNREGWAQAAGDRLGAENSRL
jgi:hypothetical protein